MNMYGPGCALNTGFVLPASPTPATATLTGPESVRPGLRGWVLAMIVLLYLQLYWLILISVYYMPGTTLNPLVQGTHLILTTSRRWVYD